MIPHLLLVALSLAGTMKTDTTIRLPRNGAVEIDSRSRDVIVRVGSSDAVVVHGGDGQLDGGTLQVGGGRRRDRGSAPLEVTVPSWARVEVSSIEGNLTFQGAPARLHAGTVSGFIHLNGGSGSVELENVGGDVVVGDFHGTRLSVDATSGDVTITNASGAMEVEAVNGTVTMRGIRSDRVTASSANGAVAFEGPLAPSGSYEFTSQNDDVTLTLPADVSARMRVSTLNGGLRTEIPATTHGVTPARDTAEDNRHKDRGDDGERSFVVMYGSGAAQVSIDVYNGNAVIRRMH